ncbi:phage antirepressor KilAC domain-containing protein [Azospirillum argentinense]
MSNITPFDFEGLAVRVMERAGEPWFVLADVCRVLEVGNPSDAARRLDDDEKGVDTVDTPGGPQNITVINESGLYSLILTSRKPAAKRFKKWVTAEVLPTIRKTGGYGTVATADPMAMLNDPSAMRGLLLTYTEKVIALEAVVKEQAPAVAALDRIAKSDGSLCLTDAAKDLQVRPKDLFAFARRNGWIYSRPGKAGDIAYQDKIQAGYLEHKVAVVTRADGSEKTTEQVRVTPKGLAKLAMVVPGAKGPNGNHATA